MPIPFISLILLVSNDTNTALYSAEVDSRLQPTGPGRTEIPLRGQGVKIPEVSRTSEWLVLLTSRQLRKDR